MSLKPVHARSHRECDRGNEGERDEEVSVPAKPATDSVSSITPNFFVALSEWCVEERAGSEPSLHDPQVGDEC